MQIRVDPAVPAAMARMCYEVGNTHAMLLRGEDDYTFYISDVIVYHLLRGVLEQLDGVEINLVRRRLDLTDVMPVSMEL